MNRGKPFSASDLPIDDQGRIYHLQIDPRFLAPDIVIVGDPGRAEMIGSDFLKDVEYEHQHRGLVTLTGTFEGTGDRATIIAPTKITVATSGIGTPSLEIVANELVALNEIDFESRTRKSDFPRIHILRVGTSGGLQASTRLGTPIITSYSIGIDNTGLFYEATPQDEVCARLEEESAKMIQSSMNTDSRFYGAIHPYVSRATPAIVEALTEVAEDLGIKAKVGLTVSACGFFAPQGRDVGRLKPSVPDLDAVFADFDPHVDGQRVENMEMEASFLIHLFSSLGYWAGAICPTIAHRREETFDHDYQNSVRNALSIGLTALGKLRSLYPDVRLR